MTQPAFSRRVRALEEWLGAELFDRSTQPARLTAAGEWFRGVAETLLAQVARLPGEARAVVDQTAVTLRFAATHALSFTFLPGWLRGLEARVPVGPIELVSDVLPRCEQLLVQSKVHFLLAHAHPSASRALREAGYPSATVGADTLVPVSAPGADGRPLHAIGPGKAPLPLLSYSDESGLGHILREALAGRRDAPAMQPAFTAHLASVLKTMALDGRGLAWLPGSLVQPELDSGRLLPAAGPEWQVPLAICLFRDRIPLGPAAERFWEEVTRTARDPVEIIPPGSSSKQERSRPPQA
jgi:DNA-binding transcriptional LysR family regulator